MRGDGLDGILWAMPSTDLATLEELPLHRHFDRKHLVPVDDVPELLRRLGPGTAVLEVGGERAIRYTSVYFDTPELTTYRDHRQGKRRRYKIRSRHYGDPAATLLEVKAKGLRGRTVKHRTPQTGPSPDVLGEHDLRFLTQTIVRLYGLPAPEPLGPILDTRFLRTTLLAPDGDRVTIDRDLHIVAGDRTVWFDRAWAVVESKSDVRHPVAEVALRQLGARRERISKYCLGVAALHPELPSNRWRRSQRLLTS